MTRLTLAAILFATTALADGPAPAPLDPVVAPPSFREPDRTRTEPDGTRPAAAPERSERPRARPEPPREEPPTETPQKPGDPCACGTGERPAKMRYKA